MLYRSCHNFHKITTSTYLLCVHRYYNKTYTKDGVYKVVIDKFLRNVQYIKNVVLTGTESTTVRGQGTGLPCNNYQYWEKDRVWPVSESW